MGVVKVHGLNQSPYTKRVEIALKLKGIEYEFVEEDLQNKSPELVKYNPVHKKVPVLVHDGKPIVESLIILEYIDETWEANPLLPNDPYERAQARFWAKFIDDKLLPGLKVLGTLASRGEEEAQKALEEAHNLLNFLERELSGKKFFGGNNIGYVDVVGIIVAHWLPIFQELNGMVMLLTKEKYPAICNWAHNLSAWPVFKETLPDREKLLALYRAHFQANYSK